jgi:iron-sulfur cluster repair protein YtfE (RIC family)
MTETAQEAIDFTMMYVTHNALRRDLRRFESAVAANRAATPGVRAGWQNFKSQLHVHHTVEDDDLWPRLYRAVTDRPEDHAMLKAMEAEHAVLDPMLDRVDATLANGDQASLSTDVEALSGALDGHLQHEETSALPLVQAVLTAADWRAFGGAMRRRQGLTGAAVYVPWIVDGATPADRNRFFSVLPTPVQMINRVFWEPRYRRLGLWSD